MAENVANDFGMQGVRQINILRHSRRFFICAYKALLPAA
ncbi:flagellar biosynthesis protein FlgF, partial [Yersinia pestis]|nr:flagellar biosynthesis protein FlgF [Yersinia pestis]MBE7812815.1 flagellar biosynthesis protein FlgF [Yersinia pestis]MBE7829186.1 flagellar biosynthesis protein FlgF [Yersinia pestis]MBE7870317.1 flagellar biosynthesis protein FlgF [Yersinia pestis]